MIRFMTTVGHTILGLVIGVACMPARWGRLAKAGLLLSFALLANLPDWPLPRWGHNDYSISHSLLCVGVLAAAMASVCCLWPSVRRALGGPAVGLLGAAAILSHLLLDSLYNHNGGVMIGWPFGRYWLNLSLPWFTPLYHGWDFSPTMLRILMVEAAFFLPVLALSVTVRTCVLRGRPHKKEPSDANQGKRT